MSNLDSHDLAIDVGIVMLHPIQPIPTSDLSRPPRWRLKLFGLLRVWALRVSCATWRKRSEGLDALDRMIASDAAPIVVFWHAKYVALLPLLAGRNACVFTSLSARGDAIADLLLRFGYRPVQLPDFGGDASLALMHESLADGLGAAIAVDGPLGPRHIVHRGAVQLAASLGRPIVPISLAVCPKRVLAARWDRLELPRLFARVQLLVGEPIAVPPNLAAADVERWSAFVHDALECLDAETEAKLLTR